MSVIPLHNPNRDLPSWIDYFIEYTADIQSPEKFRRWAGISAIAGALERKVHIISQGSPIYPNLYIFLVGPPGSGKTRAVEEGEQLWRALSDHRLAPTSLTKAALIDALKEATRAIPGHPDLGTFNSLTLFCKELGALLPGYDSDFMNALTYLYDNLPYSEKRRSKDTDFKIEHPQLNFIACTTPSYLTDMMPPGAWDQGFLSRCIICYDDILEIVALNLSDDNKRRDPTLERALKKDIQTIGNRVGRLKFEKEAADVLQAWNMSRFIHQPNHPRLTHYNTRRVVHLLKLCIIATADAGASVIRVQDVQRAQNWLTEVEGNMPDLFLALSSGGDARVINECHHWVIVTQLKQNAPVPMSKVRQYLAGRIASHSVEKTLLLMISSKMLIVQGDCVTAKPI